MFGYTGTDLVAFLFFVPIAVPFLWEATKEKGSRRIIAAIIGFAGVAVGLLWHQISAVWPSLSGKVIAFITSFDTWAFIVLVAASAFFLSSPVLRQRSKKPEGEPEEAFRQRIETNLRNIGASLEAVWERINELGRKANESPTEDVAGPKVDWGPWKARSRYTLKELGRLLDKQNPVMTPKGGNSFAYQRLLIEAAVDRSLKAQSSPNSTRWDENATVEKADAIDWAKARKFDVSHFE